MSPRTPAPNRLRLLVVVIVVAVVAAVSASLATGALAGDATFRDVPPGHPFSDEIAFTADSGIAEGFPDGTFRPGEPVSRQAMAAFLQRAQSYRVVGQHASAANVSSLSANVACDRTDHVAISGGAVYQGPGRAFIAASGPGFGNGWSVTMATDDSVLRSMSMTAFAVCVPGSRTQPEAGD
ncbi:hypothetical protein B7486_61915 [cyanobacterium TDX16]|nr:hypothetical protein B7486_61915 [cyanobacterium TDX16]